MPASYCDVFLRPLSVLLASWGPFVVLENSDLFSSLEQGAMLKRTA
jgi:hypothetical protein